MSDHPRRLALLVNPVAGGGRALAALPSVLEELDRLGAEHTLTETRSLDHARAAAREAAERGDTVVALGGDGFVGALAGAVRGTAGALAVIPLGRANDFARVLGLPRRPAAAARLAALGPVRTIDVGDAGGTTFLCIAGVGLESSANAIAARSSLTNGTVLWLTAIVRAVARWRHATFRLTVDGAERTLVGYQVSVANASTYGGGVRMAPDARLDDGRLDLVTIAHIPKLRAVLGVLPRAYWGGHVSAPGISVEHGTRVEVAADRPFVLYADGEPVGPLPLTVLSVPAALRVIAPG